MRLSSLSKVIVCSLLLGISAFAADVSGKGSLNLGAKIVVNGKQLQAGEYEVKWEGAGPMVTLSILHGNKILTTVQAQVVDLSEKASDNSTQLRTSADGSKTLSGIQFAGKKYALTVGADSGEAQAKASVASK